MGYSSTTLNDWCNAKRGRLSELVLATGLHAPNLSRVRSGDREMTLDMVDRITRHLDEDWAGRLVIAWLHDQTPRHASHLVSITPTRSTALPETTEATPDHRAALRILGESSEHNHDLQVLLIRLANLAKRVSDQPAPMPTPVNYNDGPAEQSPLAAEPDDHPDPPRRI